MSKNKKSDRTRVEILDAAWALIAEHGASISISDIAAAVGITRQSIYVHFGSRGGLLMALVIRADERADIETKFETALAVKGASARLAACLDVWFGFVPGIFPVARDLIRLRASDAEAAAAWDDRMSALRRMYGTLARSLKEDGALAPDWTPQRAADYLWVSTSVESWGLLTQERSWSATQTAATIKRSLALALLKQGKA